MSDQASASTESPLVKRRRRIWTAAACATLILAAVAAYSDSFHGPFIFDDLLAIQENRSIRKFPALESLFSSEVNSVYRRPVANLTLAVNYAIGGLNVSGYHAGNLLIHLLSALLLFGIVRRTLTAGRWTMDDGPRTAGARAIVFRPSSIVAVSFAVALIWAVHPLQTESVTYLAQRTELLAGLFFLLTLYAAIRGASSGHPPPDGRRASWRWYAVAIAACALGMGAKEVMATAPIIVLLYDRSFLSGSFREAFRRRLFFYLGLAATWGILLTLLIAYPWGADVGQGFSLPEGGLWEYARTQPGVIVHYLRLSFWPSSLCLDYAWPIATRAGQIIPPAAVLAALLAGTVWALRRAPAIGFLGAWFFLILAPSSSFMPMPTEAAAERRMYLPLAAVVTAAVIASCALVRRLARPSARPDRSAAIAAVALAVAAVALGGVTFRRNSDYRSAFSIWQDTAIKAPANPRAWTNLGRAIRQTGPADEAVRCFNRALELKPDYADAYVNRAFVFARVGRSDLAIRDYSKAIQSQPGWPLAYNSRGKVYADLGRLAEAERDYDEAIKLQPDYAIAYVNRGNVRAEAGRGDDALADYDQAIALQPDFAEVYCNRADARDGAGRFAEAVQDYARAIALKPGLAEAYGGRATAWYHMKEYGKALADLETCEKLHGHVDPGFRAAVMQASGRVK